MLLLQLEATKPPHSVVSAMKSSVLVPVCQPRAPKDWNVCHLFLPFQSSSSSVRLDGEHLWSSALKSWPRFSYNGPLWDIKMRWWNSLAPAASSEWMLCWKGKFSPLSSSIHPEDRYSHSMMLLPPCWPWVQIVTYRNFEYWPKSSILHSSHLTFFFSKM